MPERNGIESVLHSWPAKLPRHGVASTMQGEQIVFADFSLGNGCVLLQRATPDSMGGREVILPLAQVAAIKLTEFLQSQMAKELGFQQAAT